MIQSAKGDEGTAIDTPRLPTRPLPYAGMVLAVIAGFLALDHFADANEQLLLGAATWLILIASCASLDREDRARALLVVVVATCAEVIGSILLGAYTSGSRTCPPSSRPATAWSSWRGCASANRARCIGIRGSSCGP